MQPLAIAVLAVIGFGISFYINRSKANQTPIVCMIGHDCNAVVNSKYGSMFGISNDKLGMAYYVLYFIIGVVGFFAYSVIQPFEIIILGISMAAATFSILLVGVMAFILKSWCDYCVASAIVNVLIVVAYFI